MSVHMWSVVLDPRHAMAAELPELRASSPPFHPYIFGAQNTAPQQAKDGVEKKQWGLKSCPEPNQIPPQTEVTECSECLSFERGRRTLPPRPPNRVLPPVP